MMGSAAYNRMSKNAIYKTKNRVPPILRQGNPVIMVPIDFGNPAIPVGPVAFRPPIARSLALSVVSGGPDQRSSLIEGLPLFTLLSEVTEESFRIFWTLSIPKAK